MDDDPDFPLESFVSRDQGRDLMAEIIDLYMSKGGEFRSYDLVDRITAKLNQRGWWFVHGGDVERMISQEHPFNAKMAEREAALGYAVDHHWTRGQYQFACDELGKLGMTPCAGNFDWLATQGGR